MEKSNLNQESKGMYLFPTSSLCINKGATLETRLPSDIIAIILSRLPVKSIVRFRCVCKQWFYLSTEDSHFIAQYGNASLKRRVLIPEYADLSTKVPLYEIGSSGDIKDISVHIKLDGQGTFFLSNAVNGLVYARDYLINPFTRDVVKLPKSSRRGLDRYAGFGFDESFRGHWKMVGLIRTSYFGCCICEVLTVGTPEWRYVGNTPPMVPFGAAVFLNGSLYWLVYISYEPLHLCIFAFDIKHEKFQLVSMPMAPHDPCGVSASLQELRGHICLVLGLASRESGYPRRILRIWMLNDCETYEWELKYNIDLSNWFDRYQFRLYKTQIIEVQDGKILMQNSWVIYSYDLQSKTLHKLSSYPETAACDVYWRCHVITKSLVSPRNLSKLSTSS